MTEWRRMNMDCRHLRGRSKMTRVLTDILHLFSSPDPGLEEISVCTCRCHHRPSLPLFLLLSLASSLPASFPPLMVKLLIKIVLNESNPRLLPLKNQDKTNTCSFHTHQDLHTFWDMQTHQNNQNSSQRSRSTVEDFFKTLKNKYFVFNICSFFFFKSPIA